MFFIAEVFIILLLDPRYCRCNLFEMSRRKLKYISKISLCSSLLALSSYNISQAQQNISVQEWQSLYKHGIEQYQHKHYDLAAESLREFILSAEHVLFVKSEAARDKQIEEAKYYLTLSNIKRDDPIGMSEAEYYIQSTINPFYKQRVAFNLAKAYFEKNQLEEAIVFYELAGVDNLSNDEVADAKFELAYSYFNNQDFASAKPLFRAIKELPKHKYYIPGNYYYGLLAYNDKNYEEALKSFERIEEEEIYRGVVPYYKAEISYFSNQPEKVLAISKKYLGQSPAMYYEKEMHLLTAQTYFEKHDYRAALPHFEYYYDHSEYIRKEELYELAYTYYRLEQWNEAVEMFQPLSNTQDTLGQTSMYLLGDCYLKLEDKRGARNAFAICMDMDYTPQQKEAAMFLYSKLSFELGDESMAMRKFDEFVKTYPKSEFNSEAKVLLSHLLTKNNDYEEAFKILSDTPPADASMWSIYQQVTVGRAMQLLQQKDYSQADELLSLSLQQPNNKYFEAIAYFWKSEIAYAQQRYPHTIQYGEMFLKLSKGSELSIQEINPEVTVSNAHFNIGHAYLAQDDYDKAQKEFAASRKKPGLGVVQDTRVQADAALREADMLFMQNSYKEAAKLYELAIQQEVSNMDYALYQKAMIHGILKENTQKRNTLQALSQKKHSQHKYPAQLELANMLVENGEFEESIRLFNSIYQEENVHPQIQSKALLGMAFSYSQQGRRQLAKESYQKYLEKYPQSSEKEYALDALGSIYMSEGNPEGYFNYLRSHNIAEVDESTVENTFYDAAIRDFASMNFEGAEASFSKYLSQYPKGVHSIKSHYYRGESRLSLGQETKALSDFDAVLKNDWSEFTEEAANKASQIAWQKHQYEEAYDYYQQLKEVAINQDLLQKAYVGVAKSAYELGEYDNAYSNAESALAMESISIPLKEEAQLIKANVLVDRGEFAPALTYYEELKNSKQAFVFAPAYYHIAYIAYRQNNLTKAEEAAATSAQNAGGQEYWTVSSYLLLAQILFENEDYFNAKALLQGIVSDPSESITIMPLKREAQLLYEEAIKKEKAKSKLKD